MEKEMPYSVGVAKRVLAFVLASMALSLLVPFAVVWIYLTSETAKPQILFGILLPLIIIPGGLFSAKMIYHGIKHDEKLETGI